VKPSSSLQAFDPLCEVQSDKATVEITSPFEGTLKTLLVPEGGIAKVGEGLCLIEVELEDGEEDGEALVDGSGKGKEEESTESTAVLAPPPTGTPTQPPVQPRRPHPLDPNAQASSSSTSLSSTPANATMATPSVRHFARQSGITDLSVIGVGSGRGGRIEKKDVDAWLSGARGEVTERSSATGLQETMGEDMTVELGRTRHGMFKSMTKVSSSSAMGFKLRIMELTF